MLCGLVPTPAEQSSTPCLLPLPRYILVYPQGCDVCNHLSLFLCVADYDRLLPGEHSGNSKAPLTLPAVKHGSDASLTCRMEPFCSVYYCSSQQGPQEVKVLR
jgi:hypothetical protein